MRDRLPGEIVRQLFHQVVELAQRSGSRLAVDGAARGRGRWVGEHEVDAAPTVWIRAASSSDILIP